MSDLILVADIGGTNARFACAAVTGGRITLTDSKKFRAADYKSVADAASTYLDAVHVRPMRGCFAVAGPVTDQQIEFTNSPWVLNIAEVASALSLIDFRVINDFEALAFGVEHLAPDAFVTVKNGVAQTTAPTLVIGPGTGLGQSLIVPCRNGRAVIATEGGHVAYAPCSKEEASIIEFIAREHPRVSLERLLSGDGLVNIYRALCENSNTGGVSLQAHEVTAAAITGNDAIAEKAVQMFCAMLGSAVGDAVLSTGARGGIVLGGGILPKIRDLFLSSAFVERFVAKGRLKYYLADIPVRMIVGEGAALFGAAAASKESGTDT